jgi:hypothetical protein
LTRLPNEEAFMNTKQYTEAAKDPQPETTTPGNAVEFIAVVCVLVFVACTAASLLLATLTNLQAATSTPPEIAGTPGSTLPERPFHERYPVNAVADPVDPPTF